MRTNRSSQLRHKGFTLVELLVVISIIAVLISFLLPALSRARQSASQIGCLVNIRTASVACITYTQDSDGFLPQSVVYGWPFILVQFPADSSELRASGLYPNYIASWKSFYCPSVNDDQRPGLFSPEKAWDYSVTHAAYREKGITDYNFYLCAGWDTAAGKPAVPDLNVNSLIPGETQSYLARSSEVVVVNCRYGARLGVGGSYAGIVYEGVHLDGNTQGYLDGHAAFVNNADMQYDGYWWQQILPGITRPYVTQPSQPNPLGGSVD